MRLQVQPDHGAQVQPDHGAFPGQATPGGQEQVGTHTLCPIPKGSLSCVLAPAHAEVGAGRHPHRLLLGQLRHEPRTFGRWGSAAARVHRGVIPVFKCQ